jgi:hypothetical protein
MTDAKPLQRGEAVPHFEVRTIDGHMLGYSAVWQRRNLVFVTLPTAEPYGDYVSELTALASEFHNRETTCVMTQDGIPGLPAPGVLVADRWGEIVHVATGSTLADLPPPRDLLDWVEYLQHRCPECEGEAR